MKKWKIFFPYILFGMIAIGIVFSNVRTKEAKSQLPDTGEKVTDPVCRMEVNVNWEVNCEHEGKEYHFCTTYCRDIFLENPEDYMGDRCMVCRKGVDPDNSFSATFMDNVYYLCTEQHRQDFKADPASYFMHRMWGIPDWLYYVSIGITLLISFGLFEGAKLLGRKKDDPKPGTSEQLDRIDLMKIPIIRKMLLSRIFRFSIQLITAIVFLVIIGAGLFGHQNPALNIAPILTWTIWWCGLVVLIMFAGKAWCYMCPWDAIAMWMEKLKFWKKTDEGMGLALPWPRAFRNITIATFFFVGLTWVELGFGITMIPRATAYVGIAMLLMTIASAFIFERKSFCRYGCLVGRVSGLYALFAGIEFRNRDKGVCGSCETKECVKGSQEAYECPTFEKPYKMDVNTYCIQCTECLQACPHDNMAVNLRPWGADLEVQSEARRDEAYLALLMLSISAFHGLTMTPVWEKLLGGIETFLPMGRLVNFSLSMTVLLASPIVVYAALMWVSFAITKAREKGKDSSGLSYNDYFVNYAYCLLPIALFYHLAHNLEHLLMEGPKIITRISDPFGWNWNIFGTAHLSIPPLVSLDILWVLQVVLVGVGHIYSLWAAEKISSRVFREKGAATWGQVPVLIGMIIFSILSLWLLKQPMEMRISAM